jgi:hypothetical protein
MSKADYRNACNVSHKPCRVYKGFSVIGRYQDIIAVACGALVNRQVNRGQGGCP